MVLDTSVLGPWRRGIGGGVSGCRVEGRVGVSGVPGRDWGWVTGGWSEGVGTGVGVEEEEGFGVLEGWRRREREGAEAAEVDG